jgi:hypothetical protein
MKNILLNGVDNRIWTLMGADVLLETDGKYYGVVDGSKVEVPNPPGCYYLPPISVGLEDGSALRKVSAPQMSDGEVTFTYDG